MGNLLVLLAEVAPGLAAEMAAAKDSGSLRYGELKAALADGLAAHLRPIAQARRDWQGRPGEVQEILAAGAARALAIARPRLAAARSAVGLAGLPRGRHPD